MSRGAGSTEVGAHVIEALHAEALLLADEARSYFEDEARDERGTPEGRVLAAAEGLKLTTRLMHVVAWLLTQKAVAAGEMAADASNEQQRLGAEIASTEAELAALPPEAQRLVRAGLSLFERVARLDQPAAAGVGARGLLDDLKARL